MPEVTCKTCGVVFHERPSLAENRKFCSKKCFGIDQSKRETIKIKSLCLVCGKEFVSYKSSKRKYCSPKCSVKSRVGKVGPNKGVKFSDETRKKQSLARKGNYLKEKSSQWKGGETERICIICGNKFLVPPSAIKHGGRNCCSVECGIKSKIGKGKPHTEETKLKMSLSQRGKPRYNLRGDKNPRWKGGVKNFKEKIRNSFEYVSWRQKIFIRDNFTCRKCGVVGKYLEAHHLKSFSKLVQEARKYLPLFDLYTACMQYTPMWNIDNGITMCKPCHLKTKSYGRKLKK